VFEVGGGPLKHQLALLRDVGPVVDRQCLSYVLLYQEYNPSSSLRDRHSGYDHTGGQFDTASCNGHWLVARVSCANEWRSQRERGSDPDGQVATVGVERTTVWIRAKTF
jgi:hypothetical protein